MLHPVDGLICCRSWLIEVADRNRVFRLIITEAQRKRDRETNPQLQQKFRRNYSKRMGNKDWNVVQTAFDIFRSDNN